MLYKLLHRGTAELTNGGLVAHFLHSVDYCNQKDPRCCCPYEVWSIAVRVRVLDLSSEYFEERGYRNPGSAKYWIDFIGGGLAMKIKVSGIKLQPRHVMGYRIMLRRFVRRIWRLRDQSPNSPISVLSHKTAPAEIPPEARENEPEREFFPVFAPVNPFPGVEMTVDKYCSLPVGPEVSKRIKKHLAGHHIVILPTAPLHAVKLRISTGDGPTFIGSLSGEELVATFMLMDDVRKYVMIRGDEEVVKIYPGIAFVPFLGDMNQSTAPRNYDSTAPTKVSLSQNHGDPNFPAPAKTSVDKTSTSSSSSRVHTFSPLAPHEKFVSPGATTAEHADAGAISPPTDESGDEASQPLTGEELRSCEHCSTTESNAVAAPSSSIVTLHSPTPTNGSKPGISGNRTLIPEIVGPIPLSGKTATNGIPPCYLEYSDSAPGITAPMIRNSLSIDERVTLLNGAHKLESDENPVRNPVVIGLCPPAVGNTVVSLPLTNNNVISTSRPLPTEQTKNFTSPTARSDGYDIVDNPIVVAPKLVSENQTVLQSRLNSRDTRADNNSVAILPFRLPEHRPRGASFSRNMRSDETSMSTINSALALIEKNGTHVPPTLNEEDKCESGEYQITDTEVYTAPSFTNQENFANVLPYTTMLRTLDFPSPIGVIRRFNECRAVVFSTVIVSTLYLVIVTDIALPPPTEPVNVYATSPVILVTASLSGVNIQEFNERQPVDLATVVALLLRLEPGVTLRCRVQSATVQQITLATPSLNDVNRRLFSECQSVNSASVVASSHILMPASSIVFPDIVEAAAVINVPQVTPASPSSTDRGRRRFVNSRPVLVTPVTLQRNLLSTLARIIDPATVIVLSPTMDNRFLAATPPRNSDRSRFGEYQTAVSSTVVSQPPTEVGWTITHPSPLMYGTRNGVTFVAQIVRTAPFTVVIREVTVAASPTSVTPTTASALPPPP